jgi:hypothetical protein
MAYVRSLRGWPAEMYALIRNSEALLLALGALKAVASLASVVATTAGVCVWLVAFCEVGSAVARLGDSPIATVALLGGFCIVGGGAGTLLVLAWIGAKNQFEDYLDNLGRQADLARRLGPRSQRPSPAQETARECVEAVRKHSRAGLEHVEHIAGELRAKNADVTIYALYRCLHALKAEAVDPEWTLLYTFAECVYQLVAVPAQESFDRAVAEGACPVALLEEILDC